MQKPIFTGENKSWKKHGPCDGDRRVVESVGEGVDEFKEGDSVVPVFLAQCRDCVDCRESQSNICSKFKFGPEPGMPRDGTTRFTGSDGSPIHHTIFVSSFVEYTVVDAVHLVKVDPRVPPQIACLLSCGVSTGMNSHFYPCKIF